MRARTSRWPASCIGGWVEAGHEVFLDRDLRDGIAVGEEWEKRLQERLRWANAMVCVVTSAYLASSWCLAEVSLARSGFFGAGQRESEQAAGVVVSVGIEGGECGDVAEVATTENSSVRTCSEQRAFSSSAQ